MGEVLHYISTEEWQDRGSEHIHFLFWCDENFEQINTGSDDRIIVGDNTALVQCIEKFVCMQVPDAGEIINADKESPPTSHDEITYDPLQRIENIFDEGSDEARENPKDLAHVWNIHGCTRYCTKKRDSGL